MAEARQFTLDAIVEALLQLDVEYRSSGTTVRGHYAFKSLRAPERHGIYYAAGDRGVPPEIMPSIVLCERHAIAPTGNAGLHVVNPQLVFYRLMQQLVPGPRRTPGLHPTAIVDDSSAIAPSAAIGPYCVIEGARISENVQLFASIAVMAGTTIEADVTIEPHSTLGATGVAWIWNPESGSRVIQPQIGYTRIGTGCFLGSDVTVVRGSVNETTRIGAGSVIAHGSKIGHGCEIGEDSHLANNVSLGGNVILGKRCFIGSGAVIRAQTRIADDTIIGAGAVVVHSVSTPHLVLTGNPARPRPQPRDRPLAGVPFSPPTETPHDR